MIVLSANKISQIECLAFLWCLLSHKTSCHPWPESWYNKPEYANGKQSKLAYGFLVEELHQWNSRALQTFPAIRTFAHKNNKTAHRRKSILLLWVMKISKHLLQEFLTVESSERLPNYIDLSCTEIIISLSPYLIQFLNPCDRWILTPKLGSVILPSDWSEYNKSSGAFAPFSSCSKRSLLEQFGGLLFPRLFLHGHCLHFFFQGSYQDHKRSCANKARTWLFIYFLRCYVISSLQWIPLSEFFCFLFPAQDFSLCLEMSLVFMVVLLILSELRGASFSFIHFLVVLLFKRTS